MDIIIAISLLFIVVISNESFRRRRIKQQINVNNSTFKDLFQKTND